MALPSDECIDCCPLYSLPRRKTAINFLLHNSPWDSRIFSKRKLCILELSTARKHNASKSLCNTDICLTDFLFLGRTSAFYYSAQLIEVKTCRSIALAMKFNTSNAPCAHSSLNQPSRFLWRNFLLATLWHPAFRKEPSPASSGFELRWRPCLEPDLLSRRLASQLFHGKCAEPMRWAWNPHELNWDSCHSCMDSRTDSRVDLSWLWAFHCGNGRLKG